MQFIFAGKAHPKDEPGKQLIQTIANLRHDPRFANRVVFVEDYDINVCRHMIQGVDVWLNNPRRPLEASRHQRPEGRAQRRPEPVDPRRLVGRSLRRRERLRHRPRPQPRRRRDHRPPRRASRSTSVLEEQVVPMYYDRDVDGLPRHWIKRMMNSHQHAGLAVQRPPHGDGLRPPLLRPRRRRPELRDEHAVT